MIVLNFDSKQCERTRRQLGAYVSNELLVETTGEVSKHLESCEACSRELESRIRVREALREAVEKQLPPDELRQAVHRSLRKAQPRFFWGFGVTTWALAMAGLTSVILAGVVSQQWLRLRHGRQMVATVLSYGVSDHLHCAIKGHNYPEVAYPPDQLRKKLGPRYAGLLQVVNEKLPGFQVLEAHICHVPGSPRKYVHFIARGHGTILSVILTKQDGAALPVGKMLAATVADGVSLYQAHLDGMNVAGFEANGYFGFVVADLGQKEVLEIAAALAPPVRDALAQSSDQQQSEMGRPTIYGPFV
ncbi:MAG: anti-sigma factor family protein [Terriglobia bacterium]